VAGDFLLEGAMTFQPEKLLTSAGNGIVCARKEPFLKRRRWDNE
jgi:hypothetical protein